MPAGDLPRAVGAAVVRDEDLTGHAFAGKERLRFSNARPDRLSLIEAGHEDGQFEFGRPNEPYVTLFQRGVHIRLASPSMRPNRDGHSNQSRPIGIWERDQPAGVQICVLSV
jgi:hypothetical protein